MPLMSGTTLPSGSHLAGQCLCPAQCLVSMVHSFVEGKLLGSTFLGPRVLEFKARAAESGSRDAREDADTYTEPLCQAPHTYPTVEGTHAAHVSLGAGCSPRNQNMALFVACINTPKSLPRRRCMETLSRDSVLSECV